MDVESKYRMWLEALTDEQRADALAVQGELPRWMVDSLQSANIPLVRAELSDGSPSHEGYLMPTRLAEFLRLQLP